MKTVWKWIIGIVIVLVVIAALVGGAFLMHARLTSMVRVSSMARPAMPFNGSGRLPSGNNGTPQPGGSGRFPGGMPYGSMWAGRGMYMRGPGRMMGFGRMNPMIGLFGGLIWLGLLVLIVLAIIWMVRALRRPAAVVGVAAPMAATHPCPKCDEPVQENWKYCPYCGKKL
ncbi:MAG: zinc ribbon domain-containing protein [Anaerolineales bacterium]